jgi:hypothetical protein
MFPNQKNLLKKYQTQFTNWLNRIRRSTRTNSAPRYMASLPPRAEPKLWKDLGDGTY